MIFSKKLKKFHGIKHCFFSRKGGYSTGIYRGLNCGRGSKDFKKPVVVCLHPTINSREVKKFRKSGLLKGFKIVQYKTKEYIYKSFIVTTFDTSAVVDAALLKKKIIGLYSNYMDINQINHAKTYPYTLNIFFICIGIL